MLLFLQNWRAAVIPLIAVPVAIVGTFAALSAIGFSINTLSLFGLVLAIGIVVDDAIVVVENVQRLLDEGHSPREAARRAMDEVTGPVIAVALGFAAVILAGDDPPVPIPGEANPAFWIGYFPVMALGILVPGLWAGALQEWLGYQRFFIWVMVATIPSFLVCWLIPLDAEFGRQSDDAPKDDAEP